MTLENYLKNKRVQTLLAFTAVVTLSLTVGPAVYANAEDMLTATPSDQADNSAAAPSQSSSGFTSGPAVTTQSVSPILKPSFTFLNSQFVQAGIGLRNVGSGTISVHVPQGSSFVKAYLYWTQMDAGTFTAPATSGLNVVYLNGERVVGTLIGSTTSPCWTSPNIYVYRADVTADMSRRGGPISDQYISTQSALVTSVSPWVSAATQQAESAHLIIVYKPSGGTTSSVKIFDATGTPGTLSLTGGTTFTAPFAAHVATSPVSIGYALADGQFVGVSPSAKSFSWTTTAGTTLLAAGEMYGRDPSITSLSSFQGSLSDTTQYATSVPVGATSGTFTWNTSSDCLTAVYAVVQS